MNELEGNFDKTDKPFEMSSDGEKKAVDKIVDENVQDEEYFELYVEHNFSEVHDRFISGNRRINCYFCKYVSKCEKMINIQEELNDHLKTYHSEIIETYDPDNFESESDYHQDFHDFFVM